MKGKTHSTDEIIRILRQVDGGQTDCYKRLASALQSRETAIQTQKLTP